MPLIRTSPQARPPHVTELGKQLARRIDQDLTADAEAAGHDGSTNALIALARRQGVGREGASSASGA